jgi:hypothetical protein
MTVDRQLTATSLPTSSKVLCVVYGVIAVAALIATWSQNAAYFHAGIAGFINDFFVDTKATHASRSITVDILLFFLAAAIFMVIEARKHDIRWVWAYILGGAFIAMSVAFPLFLIARELRLGTAEGPRLRVVDTIVLAALAVAIVGMTIWIDLA